MARVCVIRQGRFPLDPRVRREVTALVEAGHSIDVICLAGDGEPRRERTGATTVWRVPLAHRRGTPVRYLLQYLLFFCAASVLCTALHLVRRFRLVQVHSMPDALVFSAAIAKLLGARVILDLHESMPEFMRTKYGLEPSHRAVRMTARLEQASIRFADLALTCTREMRDAFVRRGADERKIVVIHNSADEQVFDPKRVAPRRSENGHFVLICHGSIEDRYGHDTIVRAVAALKDELPELRLKVIGEGSFREEVIRLAQALDVTDRVDFSDGFVPLDELVQAISDADAGVVAMRQDAFRDLTQCNKMYDLVAMGKPVISSRTASVQNYFGESTFLMFDSADTESLAQQIRRLYSDAALRDQLVERAREAVEPYRWPYQRAAYQRAIDALLRHDERS